MTTLDPISLALVQNRLDHVARQMGWVMIRTSRSPIFNQSHDFSCFVTDAEGTLVSQADGIPIHTGGGGFAVRALLKAFGGRIAENDVFLLNDPYVAGGNHLPDWVIARPVFVEGTLVAFTCNRAHQSDIGGGAAGTYNPQATEIFHEGIRLPALKLYDRGVVRDDLWQLLMINTRTPHLLDGDLRAMVGSTRIGAEEVAATVRDLGIDSALAHFRGILDHADRRLRQAMQEVPDGVYRAEESFDTDCFEPMDIRLVTTITKTGEKVTVDFTGTAPQIKGFKNSSIANTYSAVYAGIASFFDADLPRNEGTFRSIEIIAPEGSIVNARAPAPMTMCTVFPAHEIMHMIWWALATAVPRRALAGWGKNSFPNASGRDAEGRTWVMYNWGGNSGAGAATGRDGFNQMGPMITLGGLTIPNAETYEQLYPVHVHRHELRQDGGGPGRHRGGTGVEYEVEFLTPAEYSFRAEGLARPTGIGVRGGSSGAIGKITLTEKGGEPKLGPPYGIWRLKAARLQIESPGGGGVGDPMERPPALVLRDLRDGLVSADAALEVYGVIVAADGKSIDLAATEKRRRTRAGADKVPA